MQDCPTEPGAHHLDLLRPGTGSAINRTSISLISLGCSYNSSQMMTGSPTLIRPNALHVELSAVKNGNLAVATNEAVASGMPRDEHCGAKISVSQ